VMAEGQARKPKARRPKAVVWICVAYPLQAEGAQAEGRSVWCWFKRKRRGISAPGALCVAAGETAGLLTRLRR